MWRDRLIAVISLAALIAFMGIVLWYVAEPDLIIVVCIVLAMAVYDFWRTLRAEAAADAQQQ